MNFMPTETGNYKSMNRTQKFDARHGGSISARFVRTLNQPLPWVTILALVIILIAWVAADRTSRAEARADAANQRITDLIASNTQMQTASAQYMNDMLNRVTTSEKETRMLEYYLLELDAKFIASSLKKPGDAISGKLGSKLKQETKP